MSRTYLATTGLHEKGQKGAILLGPWCVKDGYHKNLLNKNYTFADDIKYSTQNILDNAKYCESIYFDILEEISELLNSVHGIKKSVEYWSIILNPWLIYHIFMMHERYTRVFNVVKKNGSELFSYVTDCDENMASENSYDFVGSKAIEDYYNLQLFSLILPEFGIDCEKISVNIEKYTHVESGRETLKNLKNKAKMQAEKCLFFIQNIFLKNSAIVMADMYHLSNLDYVRLNIKAKSLLSLDTLFQKSKREHFTYDTNIRAKLIFKNHNNKDKFIDILKKSIRFTMPRYCLEGYSCLAEYADSIRRKDPKLIISSVGWYFNDRFKFYAAKMKERGVKLAGMQHGVNYGYSLYLSVFNVEFKGMDKYFSWGWKDESNSSKIKILPSPHLSKLKERLKQRGKYVLFISTNFPKYFYTLVSYPGPEGMETYFDQQFLFFKHIPERLKQKILYRPYPADYGRNIKEEIEKILPSVKWANKGKAYKWMEKARVVIIDNPGTSFVEALVKNIPIILFCDFNLWTISNKAVDDFNMLQEVGIVCRDPISASRKLEKVFDDTESWWQQENLQKARREFIRKYGYASKKWHDEWANELNNKFFT